MLTEIQSLSEELTREFSIKGNGGTSLRDLLPLLNKNRLAELASAYQVPGRSKMKKEQLVAALAEHMSVPDSLCAVLLLTEEREWKHFEYMLKKQVREDKGHVFGDYRFLLESGLIFVIAEADKLVFVLPDEIQQAYGKLNKTEFRKQRTRLQQIHGYVSAFANLYGAYRAEHLIRTFNEQNELPLSDEEFMDALNRFMLRDQNFDFWPGGYIVAESIESEEELDELLEKRAGKAFYVPERQELLEYRDSGYFEWTPQLERLKQFFGTELQLGSRIVEAAVDDLQLACFMESSLGDIVNSVQRFGIEFDNKQQVERFVAVVTDVYNNTRMWSNGGHTPAELGRRNKPEVVRAASTIHYFPQKKQQVTVTKVGRNDPCPCGSGLKYKKCCGK
jgi:hypothetical protein